MSTHARLGFEGGWLALAVSVPVTTLTYLLLTMGPVVAGSAFGVVLLLFAGIWICLPVAAITAPLLWLGGRLGRCWRVFRHPLVWLAVGGGAGFLLGPAMDFSGFGKPLDGALAAGLGALVARRYVDWLPRA